MQEPSEPMTFPPAKGALGRERRMRKVTYGFFEKTHFKLLKLFIFLEFELARPNVVI
jgi:hypothetical protein